MRSNGTWLSMAEAPRDRHVILYYMQNATGQTAIGRYDRGTNRWLAKIPHRADLIEIMPRKWHPLPPLPPAEF